jgi:taurine dioxygenase
MSQFRLRDVHAAYGVEIQGLDPSQDFDDATRRELRTLFDERGLLVFPGLDVERSFQVRLCETLIGLEHPDADHPVDAEPEKEMYVSNRAPGGYAPHGGLLFHSDMMWAPTPFQVLSLYGVEIGQPAVPTRFASARSAWLTLPPELRRRVADLEVVHMTGQQARGTEEDGELLVSIREHDRTTVTPIAKIHPRTGETLMYVSQMNTSEIVGLSHDDSEGLLAEIFAHLYDPANVYVHQWKVGDLVVWDNLAIQHARSDVRPNGPVRTLRKVVRPTGMVQAEVPRFAEAN